MPAVAESVAAVKPIVLVTLAVRYCENDLLGGGSAAAIVFITGSLGAPKPVATACAAYEKKHYLHRICTVSTPAHRTGTRRRAKW